MTSVTILNKYSTAFAKLGGISGTYTASINAIISMLIFYTHSLDKEIVIFREHAPACCFYFIISGRGLLQNQMAATQYWRMSSSCILYSSGDQ